MRLYSLLNETENKIRALERVDIPMLEQVVNRNFTLGPGIVFIPKVDRHWFMHMVATPGEWSHAET